MRSILLVVALLIGTLTLNAQVFGGFGGSGGKKLKGKITGTLIDSISNLPVSYATLVLKKANRKKEKDGILSKENGSFQFNEVLTGKYDVHVSFLGYNDKVLEDVELTLKDPDYNFEKIYLIPANYVLDEVEVTGQRALIENRADKLVYNVEQDASVAGGDATDVLRKVPLLSVDLEGNVSLRGSQNVKILINGKPSGMFSANVSDALKMFPADQIKKVEVITSPSAKYDGEGTGGIINIVTKKDNIEGLAGSVNASAGTRQNSLFLNVNAGKGRIGFSSNGAMFYMVPTDAENSLERLQYNEAGDLVGSYTYSGIQQTSRLGFNGSANLFYDFNAYHAINTTFSGRGFGFDVEGGVDGSVSDVATQFENEFRRDNFGDNLFAGWDWNTDYTRKFERDEDQELVLAFQLSKNVNDQEYSIQETNTLDFLNRDAQILNDGNNIEKTIQVDYVQPLPKSFKLETGAKTVLRDIDSEYRNLLKDDATGQYVLEDDPYLSNTFLYDQDVVAGYASLSFVLKKKYSVITGVRYEHTTINGNFNKEFTGFDNGYDNWLPNFTLSRSLKNFRTLKFSYSKRIQRPSLFYVNPFNNNADRLNSVIGNPNLSPELVSQYELSYNTSFLGFTIFSSAFYRRTTDVIQQILTINDGISINSFDNVGKNDSYGLNLFTTKNINKLTIRGGGNFYNYKSEGLVGGESLENDAFQYDIFGNGEYSISGSLKADFFAFLRSPRSTLQGETPSFSIFGLGLRKDFKNSSLGIRIIEPFSENKSFNSDLAGEDFTQVTKFSIPFRSVGVNFRYKFGKVDFKERKSKIKNTDLKQGEGGDQGGGQSGGSGGVGGGGGE